MKSGRTHNGRRSGAPAAGNAACVAALFIAVAWVGFPLPLPAQSSPAAAENSVGAPAEDFTLPDLAGKQVSLSDFKGKTVVLSFWATWCLPCKAELPTIEKVYEQDKDKNVVVLTVNDESVATISDFLKQKHYDFTALIDSKRMLFKRFVIRFIPTVFVINGNGIIVRRIVGWRGSQAILAAVRAGEQSNPVGGCIRKADGQTALVNCKAEPGDNQ